MAMFCWLALENPDLELLLVPALRRALRGHLLPGVRASLRVTPALPPTQLAREGVDLPWLHLMSLDSDDRRGRLLAEPLDHWEQEIASPAISKALGGHVSLGLSDHPPLAWAACWKMGRLVRSRRVKRHRLDVLRLGLEWTLGTRLHLERDELIQLPERLEGLLAAASTIPLRGQ